VAHGKSTSYYLRLSPWGQFTKEHEFSVNRSFFNDVRRGDSVNILLSPGALDIPWYRLAIYTPK